MLIFAGARTAQASNVVVNGTFDDNTTGWTGIYSVVNGGSFPTFSTEPYFYAGDNSYLEILQTYTLSASDLSDLATTGLSYAMAGDLFGYGTGLDYATFSVEFFSSSTSLGIGRACRLR